MPHKSGNSKSFGEVVNHWGLLSTGLEVNAGDLSNLESYRIELRSITTQAQGLLSEQRAQTAAKQELSRRVEELLERGNQVASFLRLGVKVKYGRRSEKLVEFDLLPFRGRARAPKPPAPEEIQKEKDAPANE